MNVHAILHAAFEKPGIIEHWAIEKGYQFSVTHSYLGETLPDISAIDFLILMGGPQSAVKFDQYPYLIDEVELVRKAVRRQKAILGICLGAQIISESLGAKTEVSPNKEVGVFPVQLTKDGLQDPLFKLFPEKFNVMHWHNDMAGIADNGILLAKSGGCPRQIIRYTDRVYALQFHMEMTIDIVKDMLRHCDTDLQPSSQYVQTMEQLLSADFPAINKKMKVILDYLAEIALKTSESGELEPSS